MQKTHSIDLTRCSDQQYTNSNGISSFCRLMYFQNSKSINLNSRATQQATEQTIIFHSAQKVAHIAKLYIHHQECKHFFSKVAVPMSPIWSSCMFPYMFFLNMEPTPGWQTGWHRSWASPLNNLDNPHATKFIFFTCSYTFCVVFTQRNLFVEKSHFENTPVR